LTVSFKEQPNSKPAWSQKISRLRQLRSQDKATTIPVKAFFANYIGICHPLTPFAMLLHHEIQFQKLSKLSFAVLAGDVPAPPVSEFRRNAVAPIRLRVLRSWRTRAGCPA
jgi:hypothetical protein